MEACPKCNFALAPDAVECPSCGVVLSKLKAGLARPFRPTPPPPAVPANPYATPVAQIESPPIPLPAAVPPQDVITRPTLEALATMRPWIRFFAIFGLVLNSITLLGALAMLFWSGDTPKLMPIALVYLVAAAVGFAILGPLHRSATALDNLALQGASGRLEKFAIEQAIFWRRMGALCIAYLVILVILVVLAGVAGSMQ